MKRKLIKNTPMLFVYSWALMGISLLLAEDKTTRQTGVVFCGISILYAVYYLTVYRRRKLAAKQRSTLVEKS